MKWQSILLFTLLALAFNFGAAAQSKSETIAVSGECKMCKNKIETAARAAGASYAVWNVDTKKLLVKYDAKTVTTADIQQKIAAAGYDTPLAKASDEAYNNLDECCQYRSKTVADSTLHQ